MFSMKLSIIFYLILGHFIAYYGCMVSKHYLKCRKKKKKKKIPVFYALQGYIVVSDISALRSFQMLLPK